jgi:DMSO/TMAO reductase YedYZ molybdopterin-dependent catalytic subunit
MDRRGGIGSLGPFDRRVWRSPLRGPWLASFLSLGLLVLFSLEILTGYLSYVAYQPQLPGNSVTGGGPDEVLFSWRWPTSPAWLYGLNQTVHVLAGLAAMPILAAKLWTVMPKLYTWPPARSPADVLERASYALIIGSSLFLLVTGVFNIAYWYPWGFNFVQAHFYSAWIFVGAFVAHVVIKLPVMRQSFRERGVLRPLRDDLSGTRAEPYHPERSAPLDPHEPTISRRGLLGLVGAGSLGMVLVVAGQSLGGWARGTALLAPRGQAAAFAGSQGFQVNQTAEKARITSDLVGADYRLEVVGRERLSLSRPDLTRLPQHTARIPIQCVEGWVSWQTWTGVRLADLAAMAGVPDPGELLIESLQPQGAFREMTFRGSRATVPDALLALRVNGDDLSLDHGFPARVMVPASPGVRQTKWVARLTWTPA